MTFCTQKEEWVVCVFLNLPSIGLSNVQTKQDANFRNSKFYFLNPKLALTLIIYLNHWGFKILITYLLLLHILAGSLVPADFQWKPDLLLTFCTRREHRSRRSCLVVSPGNNWTGSPSSYHDNRNGTL